MPVCIYCRREDPPCGFTREHVVPEALGTFHGNVVTLTSEVCADCNQYFGDTLDLFLTRDSAEALLRFRHGLKDPAKVKTMFTRRVRVRLPADGSRWGGAHLELAPPPVESTEPYLDLVPQLGVERRDGTGWDYFTCEEIRDRADLAQQIARDYGPKQVVLYNSDETRERLLGLLEEKRIPFKKQDEFRGFPPFETGRVDAELEFTFDTALARAVAKVTFNYLAKMQRAEFVLRADFDAVRLFIRDGVGRPSKFVAFQQTPILRDAGGRERTLSGHLLVIRWDTSRSEVLGYFSPFMHMTYVVRLCARFAGVWREIMAGHHFDLETRAARPLGVSHIAPPWT